MSHKIVTKILALDLGTTTGWAVRHVDGAIQFGSQSFKPQRFEGGGMRFLRFRNWLRDFTDDGFPRYVVFEEVRRHMGVDAAHCYGGFLAVLTSWCEQRALPYEGVPVGTVKKFWTGVGNANKASMILEAGRRKFSVANDNEADALAILHWGMDHTWAPWTQKQSV